MTVPLSPEVQRQRTQLVLSAIRDAEGPVRTVALAKGLHLSEESTRLAVACLRRGHLVRRVGQGYIITEAGTAASVALPASPWTPASSLPAPVAEPKAPPAPLTPVDRARQLLGNGFTVGEVAAITKLPARQIARLVPAAPPSEPKAQKTDARTIARAGRQTPRGVPITEQVGLYGSGGVCSVVRG